MSGRSNQGQAALRVLAAKEEHVSQTLHELSESFGNAIDAKDHCTKNHSEEVAVISHMLALALKLPSIEADIIHIAGHLHDVGKIGVPDAVLGKPGPLDMEEWRLVMRHPVIGESILRPVQSLARLGVPEIVRGHHERYDGRGYPDGLKGGNIPLGARIIAVADSLSAMMQQRVYRPPMAFEAACAEIERCAGTRYDSRVVEAFAQRQDMIRQTLRLYAEDDA